MLSDLAIRNAKPQERSYKLPDTEGMYLFVHWRGGKSFRLDYRHLGKRQTVTLGAYPTVTLAEARDRRYEAKKSLAQGLSPSHEKKMERVRALVAASTTFRSVGEALMQKWAKEGQAPNTLGKKEWLMGQLNRLIGHRPVSEVEPPELLVALRTIEKKGNYETTKRLRILAGQVFRFAIASSMAQRDPTQDLRGALISTKVKHHAALTKTDDVGALLRAIDGYGGSAATVVALKLAPYVFLRPGELRQLEWSEVELDKGFLRIPESKMKLRREHRVPLAPQALALIEEIKPFTAQSRFVFPSISNIRRPMSENTLNAAIRRLGYDKSEMTSHGFRTTASTLLHESGKFRSEVIEMQLAHQDSNSVRRIYNGAEYWPERIELMAYWADYLDQLKAETGKLGQRKQTI